MNPLIQSKITILPLFTALALVCFALLPTARAVSPAPDGGYLGFNTADGTNALLSLTTGTRNTAIGGQALYRDTTGSNNTAVGVNGLFSNTSSANVAVDKARSSALFKRPTKAFQDAVAAGGAGLRVLGLPGAVPVEGGEPLLMDGKIVGAIGVSGDTSEHDGQCARTGSATLK